MTHEQVVTSLINYVYENSPVAKERGDLPRDKSLLELGILDSFAIIELVEHTETHWNIQIFDSELTKEKFGSINKMADLVLEKLGK